MNEPNANLAAALHTMAEMLDSESADAGVSFSCAEADIIAEVLVRAGYPEAAAHWLGAHAVGDDEGDGHGHLVSHGPGGDDGSDAHGDSYTIDTDAARRYVADTL